MHIYVSSFSPSSVLTYNFILARFQNPVALQKRMFCFFTFSFILLQLSSYVTGLEERLESLEALLQRVRLIFYKLFVAHLTRNTFVRYVQIRISLKSWDLQLSVDRGRLTSSRLLHLRPSRFNLSLRTFQL